MRLYPEQCRDLGLWLLIPAYNVAPWLEELLAQDQHYFPSERILVVDDGSTDETGSIAQRIGIQVLTLKPNQGKGAALTAGFDWLLERQARWIITQDGDLQHDPAYLPAFIETAAEDRFDLVIGARKRAGSMPWDRRFSNWFTSAFLSLITGQRLPDVQSGYRLIRASYLQGMTIQRRKYDLETELLLKFVRRGARIGSVPISTEYHRSASSIHRGADTLRFLQVILQHLAHRHEL